MRLTCPNCAAQYEVPDDVIPDEGRDVQCSNCGTTWFEPGADGAGAAGGDTPGQQEPAPENGRADTPPEEVPADGTADTVDEDLPRQPDQLGATQEQAQVEQQDLQADETIEDPLPDTRESIGTDSTAPRQQRGLDPALSDILREEAEREASLRAASAAAPAQGLESQPNLGLDDLPENEHALRARQAQDHMARIKGEDPRQLAAEASGQRRGILPDIEEINSTLRAGDSAAVQAADEDIAPPRKSGFARGFALTLLLFLILMMIYTNAAKIAETLPQADPYLSTYVTWVDQARLWLDAQVKALQSPQL